MEAGHAARRLHWPPDLVPAREEHHTGGLNPPLPILDQIDFIVRGLALGAFAVAGLVVFTHSAVRRRWLAPFGRWPRFIRALSDPFLKPIERRLIAGGQNPQDAPLWFLGLVAVAGLLILMLVRWIGGAVGLLAAMRSAGAADWARLVIEATTWLLMTAILIRVVGLWFGFGRYHRLMTLLYRLTDWIIEPIRRRLPPTGLLDLSPFAAYLLLFLVRELLLGLIG